MEEFRPESAARKPSRRVVRAADWSPTPAGGMSAFAYTPFSAPGKAVPAAPDSETARLAALQAHLRRQEEEFRRQLESERRALSEAEKRHFVQGLEQGRREAGQEERARYDRTLEALRGETQNLLQTFTREKDSVFLEYASQAAEVLAFALRRVFGELAGNFPEAVLPLIREAVQALGQSADLVVKVNPADLPLVEERRDFWQRLNATGEGVRCVADERVAPGGCLVLADATAARIDLESVGARLAEAVRAACADRKRLPPAAAENLPPERTAAGAG